VNHVAKVLLKTIMARMRNTIKSEIAVEQSAFVGDEDTNNAIYIIRTLIERVLEVQKVCIFALLIIQIHLTVHHAEIK